MELICTEHITSITIGASSSFVVRKSRGSGGDYWLVPSKESQHFVSTSSSVVSYTITVASDAAVVFAWFLDKIFYTASERT